MKHLKKSVFIPAMLLIYLIVMAFMGRKITKKRVRSKNRTLFRVGTAPISCSDRGCC